MEEIRTIYAVYFSPTGGTKKGTELVAQTIAKKLNIPFVSMDITLPKERGQRLIFGVGDLVVLGMPVIAGRVPNLLLPYLQGQVLGDGAVGVPMVSFGNRNFDDALVELRNLMEDAKFQTIAGGAFVSEHSFSKTLGKGRPDREDLQNIADFGEGIAEKIQSGWMYAAPIWVSGNNPPAPYYTPRDRNGNHIDIRKVKPETTENCTKCGVCVAVCPLGSIDQNDPSVISGICMKCCACVKKCPEGGKFFGDAGFVYHKEELEEMYRRRGEGQYFL